MSHRFLRRGLAAAAALALLAPPPFARAQDDAPDSPRELQYALRDAVRDTVGHADDPARLGTLGALLVRLGRFNDAEKVLGRVLAARPGDRPTLASLGKIALFRQRAAEAESLLAAAGDAEGAPRDLYAAKLRRGDWKGAAAMAEAVEDAGRLPLLERLQETNAYELLPGPDQVSVPFDRFYPVPLVRVRLNGQQVLAAVDPGAPEVLVDPSAMRVTKLVQVPGERSVAWLGTRVAARNAIAQKLQVGGAGLANVPVAVTSLHRYSIDVNPGGRDIALVIGLPALERFGFTYDAEHQRLELRRPGVAYSPLGAHVALERWSDNQLVAWGTVGGGRRMSFTIGTGLPGAGFGGPAAVFEELGLKAGKMSNLVRGAGIVLQGRPWVQAAVPTLALGSVVGDRVNGWSGAMDPGEVWRSGVRLDGLLGPDWFRGRRVTFDWAKHEMVFEGN